MESVVHCTISPLVSPFSVLILLPCGFPFTRSFPLPAYLGQVFSQRAKWRALWLMRSMRKERVSRPWNRQGGRKHDRKGRIGVMTVDNHQESGQGKDGRDLKSLLLRHRCTKVTKYSSALSIFKIFETKPPHRLPAIAEKRRRDSGTHRNLAVPPHGRERQTPH